VRREKVEDRIQESAVLTKSGRVRFRLIGIEISLLKRRTSSRITGREIVGLKENKRQRFTHDVEQRFQKEAVMRILQLLCFTVVLSSLSLAQIPNSGFESWAADPDTNYNPVGWETSNGYPMVSVEPVTPGHQGTYAMKVKTLDLGFLTLPGVAIMQAAYNFAQTPTKFGAWVRSTIMTGDTAFIIVALMKGDTVIAATDSCTFKIDSSYSQYTYLEFPIAVVSGSTPDSLYVMVASGLGTNSQVGTELIVDDIAFTNEGPVNVLTERGLPEAFLLDQNYPNPFNPETEIGFTLQVSGFTSLRVYDLLGREAAVLVDEELPAGRHRAIWNAAGSPSGIYFLRLESGGLVETRKMVLVR